MDVARDVSRLFTRGRRSRRAPLFAAAGLGAGLMYLLDPDRGARRRALARDKGAHAARRLASLFDKGARDLRFRLRGVAAEARAAARPDHPDDGLLADRVRARLGRAVTHPHAVHVEAQGGAVTLSGPVLRAEAGGLRAAVAYVPGVVEVIDRLELHDPEEHLPALQGADRTEAPLGRWSPLLRLSTGAIGVGLCAFGAVRRGNLGLVAGLAGATLLLRDAADRPLLRILGVGAGRRAVDFHKTVHVRAPVGEVYARFADVESFPRFMAHVREVRKIGDDRYTFTAEGPARVPVTWEAEITERVPDRLLAWRSVAGAAIGNAGVARFEEARDGATRIDLRMSYNPPAGALGHLIASLFGVDPKHALDQDMVRFQSLIERGKTTAHHREVRAEDVSGWSSGRSSPTRTGRS